MSEAPKYGLAGRLAHGWINSKLTPLLIGASLLMGVFSVIMLPREEEPQIIVPMIDVIVGMPGSSAREVEERATKPMEKLLWEIPGVEYIAASTRRSAGGRPTPASASCATSPCTSARSSEPASSSGTFSVLPLVLRGRTSSVGSISLMVSATACPYTGKPPPGVAVPSVTSVRLTARTVPQRGRLARTRRLTRT